EIPLRLLFEKPTLAALGAEVETALRGGEGTQAPPIVPVARTGESPLSFAQQRLWFLDQLEPGSSAYNVAAALVATGNLSLPLLPRTLAEGVRRHESLRTVFTVSPGGPVQVIEAPQPIALPEVDLAGLGAAPQKAEVRRLVAAESLRPFDLARGPL